MNFFRENNIFHMTPKIILSRRTNHVFVCIEKTAKEEEEREWGRREQEEVMKK